MQARALFGSQIWIEPDDSADRIESLFRAAEEIGLGWSRIFLMWPFIEPNPNDWRFEVYDHVFNSAACHGIKIKATRTANAGPWHTGTPSVLHSGSGFLTESQKQSAVGYIHRCVSRYASHPGLGQWLLWNEPAEYKTRGEVALAFWRNWLQTRYENNIQSLNTRWRTGYQHFTDIPFPEDITLPRHASSSWVSFRPWLDDWNCRSEWLTSQIAWVAHHVRAIDKKTPLCVNPTAILTDAVPCAADLRAQSAAVDTIGASFHPPFHFAFADRHQFPGLIASGVRRMAAVSPSVEVTEVQTGNTYESGLRPCAVTPNEIRRFHLAALAGGANSVTGWCFNVRPQDNELGDWALLDDADKPSVRSLALQSLIQKVDSIQQTTGPWKTAAPEAVIITEGASQAIEATAMRAGYMSLPGRRATDASEGAAMLALELLRRGIAATVGDLQTATVESRSTAKLLIAAHLSSADAPQISALLDRVENGATLVFDGLFARRSTDARLHIPWPGAAADRIGLHAAGMESRIGGWPCTAGAATINFVLARMALREKSADWQAWPDLLFADGEPCVLERPFGKGRLVCVRGLLAASAIAGKSAFWPALHLLFDKILAPNPTTPYVTSIPVDCTRGQLRVILAPDSSDRANSPVTLKLPPGPWLDLWTNQAVALPPDNITTLAIPDGIAILWRQSGSSGGA